MLLRLSRSLFNKQLTANKGSSKPSASPWLAASISPLIAVLWVVFWVLLAALFNPAQFPDNIEQFSWGQSLEWGYSKHPPVPSWLMSIVIWLSNASPNSAYIAAAICFSATAILTYLIARRLTTNPIEALDLSYTDRVSSLALVFWGLHLSFSWRAQIYNHNSVLVLFMALTVWAALRASQSQKMAAWLLLGISAGLALLTKYQAAIGFVGIVFALWQSGSLVSKANRWGLLLAVIVASLVFLPHLVWLINNGFMPLVYASGHLQELSYGERITKAASFILNIIRMHSLMLIGATILVILSRFTKPMLKSQQMLTHQDPRATGLFSYQGSWLLGIIGVPLILILLLCLTVGVELQKEWGIQILQFFCLFLAWRLSPLITISWQKCWATIGIVHVGLAAAYFFSLNHPEAFGRSHPMDRLYPAASLSKAAVQSWKQQTRCPLAYVAGDPFPAGLVAVYSGLRPKIYENQDTQKSPWIDPADFKAKGGLIVERSLENLPESAGLIDSLSFYIGQRKTTIYWTVLLPQQPCLN